MPRRLIQDQLTIDCRRRRLSFINCMAKLFSLRLGLNMLCSHNLKLCLGCHPISKDWMVYKIHLQHSRCREHLRPCHPHILPGQPCRSVQVLDFGTLLFLQVGSHWYRLDLRTSTKSEPASLSIMVQLTRSNVEVIFPLAHIFSLCFTSRYCIHLHLCMPYFTHCTLSLLLTDSPLVCLPLHCLFLSPCSHRLVLLPLYCNGMLSSMFNFNLLHSYQLLFHISFPGILCKSHVPILFLPF